jgi:hypothetical protein
MKKTIECLLIGICWCTFCNAQQATSTADGEGTGTGGNVSYTVGQVAYTTDKGNEGIVSQGVQQPYEISVISSIEEQFVALDLSVYPNPTSNYLKLIVENYTFGNLTCQLYDADGKLLVNKKLEGQETTIQMDELASAVYFLKVTDNDMEIKTFKIIKN